MREIADMTSLSSELQQNSLVTSVRLHQNPPISDLILEIFKETFSYSLDPDLLSVYEFANGIHLIWHHELSGRPLVGGEADIRGCLDTFAEDAGLVLGCEAHEYGEEQSDEFSALCSKMKIFDRYEESFQATRVTTLQLEEGRVSRLWFWDSDGDKYPLTLSPLTYLKEMVRAKAMLNWQYFYLETEDIDLRHPFFSQDVYGATLQGTIEAMEEFCEVRSNLFGSHDLDFYKQRLQQISAFFK